MSEYYPKEKEALLRFCEEQGWGTVEASPILLTVAARLLGRAARDRDKLELTLKKMAKLLSAVALVNFDETH